MILRDFLFIMDDFLVLTPQQLTDSIKEEWDRDAVAKLLKKATHLYQKDKKKALRKYPQFKNWFDEMDKRNDEMKNGDFNLSE